MFTEEFHKELITYDLATTILAERTFDSKSQVGNSLSSLTVTSSPVNQATSDFLDRDIERDRRLRSDDLAPNRLYLRVDDIISALSDALFKVDGYEGPTSPKTVVEKEGPMSSRNEATSGERTTG